MGGFGAGRVPDYGALPKKSWPGQWEVLKPIRGVLYLIGKGLK